MSEQETWFNSGANGSDLSPVHDSGQRGLIRCGYSVEKMNHLGETEKYWRDEWLNEPAH